MPTIRLEDVAKLYKTKERRISAIQDVNLKIEQGEFVFFIGSRGAGKSTILDIISGDVSPDRGAVFLDDVNISRVSKRRRHGCMGRVPQESGLVRTETILQNMSSSGKKELFRDKQLTQTLIPKALGLVGMAGCEDRYPVELSTSECRKIELAKAILRSPPILLLDEITDWMDDDSAWDMMHLLMELNRRGTTILMATSAVQIVNIMRKRVITLVDGKIKGDVQKGRYGYIV